jgi:hypothetical protein
MQRDLWTYREETIGDIDLTGYSVEAADGGIGKIDEATYEAGSSYLVIDTGPWIFGKRVCVPAGVVDRIDTANERVFVDLTKDQIKDAPEYDDLIGVSEEHRAALGTYYGEPTKAGRTTDTL